MLEGRHREARDQSRSCALITKPRAVSIEAEARKGCGRHGGEAGFQQITTRWRRHALIVIAIAPFPDGSTNRYGVRARRAASIPLRVLRHGIDGYQTLHRVGWRPSHAIAQTF